MLMPDDHMRAPRMKAASTCSSRKLLGSPNFLLVSSSAEYCQLEPAEESREHRWDIIQEQKDPPPTKPTVKRQLSEGAVDLYLVIWFLSKAGCRCVISGNCISLQKSAAESSALKKQKQLSLGGAYDRHGRDNKPPAGTSD